MFLLTASWTKIYSIFVGKVLLAYQSFSQRAFLERTLKQQEKIETSYVYRGTKVGPRF
jgi:hypothetical protein